MIENERVSLIRPVFQIGNYWGAFLQTTRLSPKCPLRMVAAQDYPSIELLISANGENGTKVREIIEANYRGAYRFRENPSTVNMAVHLNQIIHEASGDYFHLLNDDDEMSPNFISELVHGARTTPRKPRLPTRGSRSLIRRVSS